MTFHPSSASGSGLTVAESSRLRSAELDYCIDVIDSLSIDPEKAGIFTPDEPPNVTTSTITPRKDPKSSDSQRKIVIYKCMLHCAWVIPALFSLLCFVISQ